MIRIKALDNWELDVLGNPNGSPTDKDADGEYFTPETNYHGDKFGLPPAVYAHGLKSEHPEYIGKVISREDKPEGRWYHVVLDSTKEAARTIWEAAKDGRAFGSTGAVAHLVRKARDGKILEWPVGELTLVADGTAFRAKNKQAIAVPVLKAMYEAAGLTLPDGLSVVDGQETTDEGSTERSGVTDGQQEANDEPNNTQGSVKMETEGTEKPAVGLTPEQVEAQIVTALKAERERVAAEVEAKRVQQEEIDEAVKAGVEAETAKMKAEMTAGNRLKFNGDNAPFVGKFGDTRKYDGLSMADQACLVTLLDGTRTSPNQPHVASESAIKALILKIEEDKTEPGEHGRYAMKAAGIDAAKADEVNYSELANYGDEWVGVSYSRVLWNSVRHETNIAGQIPSIQVPQGTESIIIPLESTDPTLYLTPQADDDASSGGLSRPDPTVKSSRTGTDDNTLTVKKLSMRQRYTGELVEDSLIPWVPQLNAQMQRATAEQFEHVLIDGDTEAGASANINDINDTPDSKDAFLAFNGFRKIAIANNNRSGGALDEDDYLLTAKLLGAAGKVGLNPALAAYIIDLNTYWQTMKKITSVKTKNVWGPSAPTLESGVFTQIWGRKVWASGSMHWMTRAATGYEYKANSAGKLDLDTDSNNTTGSIVCVRWDQWFLGWKRRIMVETVRHPEWDGWENTMHMRVGLLSRDTNASAISYNLTI